MKQNARRVLHGRELSAVEYDESAPVHVQPKDPLLRARLHAGTKSKSSTNGNCFSIAKGEFQCQKAQKTTESSPACMAVN
jgi:hypothetical protein